MFYFLYDVSYQAYQTADEEENIVKTSKKKSKIKSTFNTVFRSFRSRADKLLTNILSSGNYNRLIIATSAGTAAVKRSSITDTEEDETDKCNNSSFQCGPHLTVSLGKLVVRYREIVIFLEEFYYATQN